MSFFITTISFEISSVWKRTLLFRTCTLQPKMLRFEFSSVIPSSSDSFELSLDKMFERTILGNDYWFYHRDLCHRKWSEEQPSKSNIFSLDTLTRCSTEKGNIVLFAIASSQWAWAKWRSTQWQLKPIDAHRLKMKQMNKYYCHKIRFYDNVSSIILYPVIL